MSPAHYLVGHLTLIAGLSVRTMRLHAPMQKRLKNVPLLLALAALLVLFVGSEPAHAASITIGKTAVSPEDDSGNGSLMVAQQATLSQAATIQSISFYVTVKTGKLRLGIYDATGPGGGPGGKLAETPEITPIVGWNTANVLTQVPLASGSYWLAYLPQSNSLAFKIDRSGGKGKYYSFAYGTMPITFSQAPSSIAALWSLYATLNTSASAPPPSDTTAPSIPSGLVATGVSSSQVNLSWNASTDNVGVTGYRIRRNNVQIATTASTSFQNTGLQPATTYSYTVSAYDAASNVSAPSSSASASTLASAQPPPDTTRPSIPTGLMATGVSSSQINLSWNASTDNVGVAGYRIRRNNVQIATTASTSFQNTGLQPSTIYSYTVSAYDAANNVSSPSSSASANTLASAPPPPPPSPSPSAQYGLEWPGDGAVRRMLYWHNPFPIYDATYIFNVYPRKKTTGSARYYTTFFWGNDGTFTWDNGNANTYYGAHPYPVPAPGGPGQWEISVEGSDEVTGTEVQWNRWHTQAVRVWRESASITHHEFYYDLPDLTKKITYTVNDPRWASYNPPVPAIVIGQAPNLNGESWGGYPGWEEFNGIIRGIQIYSGLLSVADIQSEIASPKSTTAGQTFMWYLNLDPRPSDVTDKKGFGTPHDPSWDGTTALEWVAP
jgi:chitodextrinase